MLHRSRILHPLTVQVVFQLQSRAGSLNIAWGYIFPFALLLLLFTLLSNDSFRNYSWIFITNSRPSACWISILLLLFCSFITLFSISFVFCKLAAPPHSPPQHTPSLLSPLSPFGSLFCSSSPPVVLRSLFLDSITPSLQSRADIDHEVREMGSHAPAVSRLKWA